MLNIKQLQKDVEDRQRKVIGNYDAILQQCYNKIMATNQKINDCYCFFSCPTFVFGVPLYNVNSCITYIMEKLILKGFEVKYTHPNLIYISWKNGLNPPVYQNADPNALNADSYQYSPVQMPKQIQYYQSQTPQIQQTFNMWPITSSINNQSSLNMVNRSNSTEKESYRPISDIYTDGSLFS